MGRGGGLPTNRLEIIGSRAILKVIWRASDKKDRDGRTIKSNGMKLYQVKMRVAGDKKVEKVKVYES